MERTSDDLASPSACFLGELPLKLERGNYFGDIITLISYVESLVSIGQGISVVG